MNYRFALLVVFLIGLSSQSCVDIQQQRFEIGYGNITGKIVDAQGNAAQAAVTVYYKDLGESVQVATDQDGEFFITNIPVGNPLLYALDTSGKFAAKNVAVLGDQTNNIGSLRLEPVDISGLERDPILSIERRITSGKDVFQPMISRSGKSILYQTEAFQIGPWHVIQQSSPESWPKSWNIVGTIESPPGHLVGLDDEWVYGRENSKIWRARIDDLEHIEWSGPFGTIALQCNIDRAGLSLFGPVCSTHVETPGSVMIWRPEDVEATVLFETEPNERIGKIGLSPDGRQIAFFPFEMDRETSDQRVIIDLEQNTKEIEYANHGFTLKYSFQGELASIHLEDNGLFSLRLQPIERSIQLPGESIIDPEHYNLCRPYLFYDVVSFNWVVGITYSCESEKTFLVNVDTMSVTKTEELYRDVGADKMTNPDGNTAYQAIHNGFKQIFTTKSRPGYPLTIIEANHWLVGWSEGGREIIYSLRDPQSGTNQLFSIVVPRTQ
jgi:hypothetical protein